MIKRIALIALPILAIAAYGSQAHASLPANGVYCDQAVNGTCETASAFITVDPASSYSCSGSSMDVQMAMQIIHISGAPYVRFLPDTGSHTGNKLVIDCTNGGSSPVDVALGSNGSVQYLGSTITCKTTRYIQNVAHTVTSSVTFPGGNIQQQPSDGSTYYGIFSYWVAAPVNTAAGLCGNFQFVYTH